LSRKLPHLVSAIAQIIQIIWKGQRAAIRHTLQGVVRQPPHLALNQCAGKDFSIADERRVRERQFALSCCQAVGGLPLTSPALSFAKIATGQKPGQAGRAQVPRGFGVVHIPGLCRPQMQLMSLSRLRTVRRSCCAGRRQFGRSKVSGRLVPIGRDYVGYCG